eukprot:356116-Chlamydomonas_euryale.AAC.11
MHVPAHAPPAGTDGGLPLIQHWHVAGTRLGLEHACGNAGHAMNAVTPQAPQHSMRLCVHLQQLLFESLGT